MQQEFDSYIQDALKSKYYPGFPELAFNILKRGGTLSKVKSTLGITESGHRKFLLEHPGYAIAIELGKEAAIANLQDIGRANLNEEMFKERTWGRLLDEVKPQLETNISTGNGPVHITFEGI